MQKNTILNFILFLFFISQTGIAQEAKKEAMVDADEVKTVEEYTEDDIENIKNERLIRIRRELVQLRSQIYLVRKEYKTENDMVLKIQQEAKLNQLELDYEKKKNLFIETITNVNLTEDTQRKKKTTFSEDIKQILDPALNTFKLISKKPRQIQELNDEIAYVREKFEDAKKALQRLRAFQKENKNRVLVKKIAESIKTTDSLVGKLKVRLEDLQFRILKIEENEESIVTTFSAIIFEFIKTKGKNLILAFTVFILVFWCFKLGQNRFINLVLFKVSKSENKEVYNWIIRPTKVIYNGVTTIIAIFLSILTLYVLNDWVLVTLILITFTALIWSSKQYVPIFMEQSKIVLNLGSVREGERLVYNGLPWKIEALGYYCKLKNPALGGATLRISTKELLTAHSRTPENDEPWFPSYKGDWVEINGHFGYVESQSPEQVIIRQLSGERVFIATENYFKGSPRNFSEGFGVEVLFGLDYAVQADVFDKIVPIFKERILPIMENKMGEINQYIKALDFDFNKANSSSLDFRFFIYFKGEAASHRVRLERLMQATMLQICNENNLTIPFNQLTIYNHEA